MLFVKCSFQHYGPDRGSCTSELQLKMNCRSKVNCRIKFGLARQTVGRSAQILSYNLLLVYNSLSASIHLYMIQALKTQHFLPDNTWSPIRWILFLVKISLTILVMLVKAPFWISVIKLLVRFTDKSLVCVENTSGVKRSEKKKKKH